MILFSFVLAGTRILAPGVIGIFFFVVSTVVLCVAHRKFLPNYRLGAIAGLYVASALLILGAVLYAYKLFTGYSFMLMTIASGESDITQMTTHKRLLHAWILKIE